MNSKKVTWIAVTILAIGGLSYIGYTLYRKSQTSSQDPNKNNRKILIINQEK